MTAREMRVLCGLLLKLSGQEGLYCPLRDLILKTLRSIYRNADSIKEEKE